MDNMDTIHDALVQLQQGLPERVVEALTPSGLTRAYRRTPEQDAAERLLGKSSLQEEQDRLTRVTAVLTGLENEGISLELVNELQTCRRIGHAALVATRSTDKDTDAYINALESIIGAIRLNGQAVPLEPLGPPSSDVIHRRPIGKSSVKELDMPPIEALPSEQPTIPNVAEMIAKVTTQSIAMLCTQIGENEYPPLTQHWKEDLQSWLLQLVARKIRDDGTPDLASALYQEFTNRGLISSHFHFERLDDTNQDFHISSRLNGTGIGQWQAEGYTTNLVSLAERMCYYARDMLQPDVPELEQELSPEKIQQGDAEISPTTPVTSVAQQALSHPGLLQKEEIQEKGGGAPVQQEEQQPHSGLGGFLQRIRNFGHKSQKRTR